MKPSTLSPRPAVASSHQITPSAASEVAPDTLQRFGGQLAARPPAGTLAVADDDQDEVMGLQLTLQWERVVGGQREQLIFGAMMTRLKAHIATGSARGASKASHDPTKQGTGLKGWLTRHAPKVSESTAYRLMEIAEGIAADFHLKRVSLEDLLAASVETLGETLAKKRAAIELMIDGKSQRQLLLEYGRAADGRSKNPGGFRPNGQTLRWWLAQEYPDRPELQEIDIFSELPPEIQKRFKAEGDRYLERLTNDQRAALENADDARAWNEQIGPAITLGIDRQFFVLAEDAQLEALRTALEDLRTMVLSTQQDRAGKRRSAGKLKAEN